MPTYDYECDACGHAFELYQGITAPVETVCPQCKKKKLRRLIGTGAAVVFKGSGFYQTDYRSEGYKKAAQSESKKTDSSSSDKSSKTADSATAAKTESATKSSESTTTSTNEAAKPSKGKKKSAD